MSTLHNFTATEASEKSTNVLDFMLHKILQKTYVYTASQSNLLFSAVAIGAMCAVYPFMYIIQVCTFFGTKILNGLHDTAGHNPS